MISVARFKCLHKIHRNWNLSSLLYSRAKMESPYFKITSNDPVEARNIIENANVQANTTKRHTRSSSKSEKNEVKIHQSLTKVTKTQKPRVKNNKLAIMTEISNKVEVKKEESESHEKWMPGNWEEVLNNIREMRKHRDAPVDNMGCEQCPDVSSPPEVRRFQILVSLMLSSQTRDQMTHAATEKLKAHGLTIQSILDTDEEVIAQLIYPRKANYLKRTAAILAEQYNYDIPNTVEQLCKLPGVGQKMAVLCVNIAWENIVGIGVDTHVHRISNRLGWTRKPTKTPQETERELEDWIPRHLWEEVNVLLVGFGQQKCTPLRPQCGSCLNRNLCPTGKTWVPSPVKEKKRNVGDSASPPETPIKLETSISNV